MCIGGAMISPGFSKSS